MKHAFICANSYDFILFLELHEWTASASSALNFSKGLYLIRTASDNIKETFVAPKKPIVVSSRKYSEYLLCYAGIKEKS